MDSLNLKFKVCDLNKVYQSKLQAKANFVSLEKGKIKEAKIKDSSKYLTGILGNKDNTGKAASKIILRQPFFFLTPGYLVSVLFYQFLRYCLFSCIYCNEI